MPLTVPQLDDRGYREILSETLARIRVHTPEWTNFNDSDPGVTLLQLFAFMAENLLYRSNRYPDLNRLKFLELLGIPLRPAMAARGVVTISNDRGPMETLTLAAKLPVLAGKVGFLTRNALDILPIQMRLYTRRALEPQELEAAQKTYRQLYGSSVDDPSALEYYKTVPFDETAANPVVNLSDDSTVDRSLWLLLLTRPGEDSQSEAVLQEIAGKTITLGIMPAINDSSRVLLPGGLAADQAPASLIYEISTSALTPDGKRLPIYKTLEAVPDNNPLADLALVQLTLPSREEMGLWDSLGPLEDGVGDFPPSLEDPDAVKRALAWIRIRLPESKDGGATALKAGFTWLGINAMRVTQRTEVPIEGFGAGTGEPDQSFKLVNTPAIPESVQITVNGEAWDLIGDLYTAPPEVPVGFPSGGAKDLVVSGKPPKPKVFAIDSESGEVRFGDGLHGARPPAGAMLLASYSYGGGRAGNVGVGALKDSPQLPAGFKVSNPIRTWGGDDGQSVSEAEKQIPHFLRHRDRAVSASDFHDIATQTPGVDLGRVEVLPLFQPGQKLSAPGAVTLLVIPNDPKNPQAPMPNRLFLDAICRHLERRRLVSTEIYLQGPAYVGLNISVGISVVAGREIAPVREAVAAALRRFLSPLEGGPDRSGWPLQKSVEARELWAQAVRADGVASVNDLWLRDSTGARQDRVDMSGLQLPRLDGIRVSLGDPEEPVTPAPLLKKRLPVPVLPVEC